MQGQDSRISAKPVTSTQHGRPPLAPPVRFSMDLVEAVMQKRGTSQSGLRQEILARYKFEVSITRIFGGKCQPSYYAIWCMAKVLDVAMEDLLEEAAA